ncbi:MAG: CAP domain-containing protein [Gemmatimonadales bacterium]|jgi:uncharacterized protein YkwD
MRRRGRGSGERLAAVLLLLFLPATSPAQDAAPTGAEARLHELVNRHRRNYGCPPLDWYAPAAAVAEHRAADMIERRYFDHVTPDGHDVFDELREAGIRARKTAENIALTQAGASAAFELWRDSPPHRLNLDDCAFTDEAIGERGGVWVQILLERPRSGSEVSPPAASPGH